MTEVQGQRVSDLEAAPFDLAPRTEDSGSAALCLHGLTGTPYEVRSVGEALAEAGLRAVGPRLAGHGDTPETLAATTQGEWVEGVRRAYEKIAAASDQVFVVGLSLGGLLSLDLAAHAPVAGVVAIGTPLALRRPIPQLVPWVKRIMPMLPKRGGSDIRDPQARSRHPGFRVMPLWSVHELVRLQAKVIRSLGQITAPALIAHGVHDHTANPADAERIYQEIGSQERELLWLERSGHVVPVDYDGALLASRIVEFVIQNLSRPLSS